VEVQRCDGRPLLIHDTIHSCTSKVQTNYWEYVYLFDFELQKKI